MRDGLKVMPIWLSLFSHLLLSVWNPLCVCHSKRVLKTLSLVCWFCASPLGSHHQEDVCWLHLRGLRGRILPKIFLNVLLCAQMRWTSDSACVISIMKHLHMAVLDNHIPACLTGNVQGVFMAKRAYQLPFFPLKLNCVDNTILNLIHAVIVRALIRAITVRIPFSPISTPLSSAVYLPTTTILQGSYSFRHDTDVYSFWKFFYFLTHYAMPLFWTDLSLCTGIIVFNITIVGGRFAPLQLKKNVSVSLPLMNLTSCSNYNTSWIDPMYIHDTLVYKERHE